MFSFFWIFFILKCGFGNLVNNLLGKFKYNNFIFLLSDSFLKIVIKIVGKFFEKLVVG